MPRSLSPDDGASPNGSCQSPPGARLSGRGREPLHDGHARRIDDLRVSVTDRCNFRCQYCMPADGLPWLDRSAVLTVEGIERLPGGLASMGVPDLRLTGGEPLVRREFPRLASMLARVD